MMEQTKIYQALKGVRGRKSVDLPALEGLMVRFSQLVVEQRWIKEIDINPLLASSEGLLALDARVVLHPAEMKEEALPKLAIRPYPKLIYSYNLSCEITSTLQQAVDLRAAFQRSRPGSDPGQPAPASAGSLDPH
jgi:hypothetical protein